MIDVVDTDAELPGPPSASLPDVLPVLPLRDSVTYPDTLTPLAIGQERSIQLVNDVLAGDRMLVMVGSRDPDVEARSRTVPIERGRGTALPSELGEPEP